MNEGAGVGGSGVGVAKELPKTKPIGLLTLSLSQASTLNTFFSL